MSQRQLLKLDQLPFPRPKALKDKAESDDMDRCRVKFLRDAETFDWLVQVLESVGKGGRVLVRAYSFDQPDVINSLKQATERGCLTMVVADRSQAAGKTKTQLQMLKELRSSGVRVRLTEGLNVSQAYERDNRSVRLGRKLRGLQHGKSAYVQTDREDRRSPVQLVVGSCNLIRPHRRPTMRLGWRSRSLRRVKQPRSGCAPSRKSMKEGSRSKITKARHKEARDVPCLAAGARDSRHQRGQPKLRGECGMPLDVA